MRYVSLAALAVAVSTLVPSALLGQIDVSGCAAGSARFNETVDPGIPTSEHGPLYPDPIIFHVQASLINTGPAIPAITATVTSLSAGAIVVSGMGNLHFPPARNQHYRG